MQAKLSEFIKNFGLPRIIIMAFFVFLCLMCLVLGLPLARLISDTLVRMGMHGILVLAMVPAIKSGIGPNFGLPLGIICGLLGALTSIELDLRGFTAFFGAILIALPIAAVVGWSYGLLLNKVKRSEMTVSTYVGFSAVSLMCIAWLMLPFKSPEMAWPIGRGVRTTITLEGRYQQVLNDFGRIEIGSFFIPTGLLLFLGLFCVLMWLFLRSKSGIAMETVGSSQKFAIASGINVEKQRVIGATISTVLGAVGIIIYGQSFGFIQLYMAPMFMGFTSVAAILIGGATIHRASIANVLIGAFLFQGLLVIALPVANEVMQAGSLAEITRIIVSNGIILYALTQVGKGE